MKLRNIKINIIFSLLAFIFVFSAQAEFVTKIKIDGPILVGTKEYLTRAINSAVEQKASAILVELNTPGGLLQVTQGIVEEIFASPIPIFIHVGPSGASAASAGVFILLAGHIAAMSPGTTLGAAHPVASNGSDIAGDMRDKVENMAAAMIRSIAEQRKRNVEWAEKAVRESSSLTATQAAQDKVVNLIADTDLELLRWAGGKTVLLNGKDTILPDFKDAEVRFLPLNLRENTYNFLSDPTILSLLWTMGTTGLAIELYNPGLVLPGVVGVLCLVIALMMQQVVSLAASGIALLVCGVVMMGLEIVVPGGVLGVGGLIAFVVGALTIFEPGMAPGLEVSKGFIGGIACLFGALMLIIAFAAKSAFQKKQSTGREGLEGQLGIVVESLTPEGLVSVNGELWKAFCSGVAQIEKGSAVQVVQLRPGLRLEVTSPKKN